MYAIKQIKICAEYRDMVPKASTGSSGSWQTRLLALGTMFQYSAQILMSE